MSVMEEEPQNKRYKLATSKAVYYIAFQDMERPIGIGNFGPTWRAYTSTSSVCIKVYGKNAAMNITEEITILTALNGAYNVVNVLDSTEDSANYYIIIPQVDMDLQKFIANKMVAQEIEALEYFRQICYGVSVLIGKSIFDGNLSTSDIYGSFYSDPTYPFKFYFCLGTVGIATKLDNSMKSLNVNELSFIYDGASSDKTIADDKDEVYALGLILYKLVTSLDFKTDKLATSVDVKTIFPTLSTLTIRILEGCLQAEKINRISFEELKKLLKVNTLYTEYKILDISEISKTFTIRLNNSNNPIKNESKGSNSLPKITNSKEFLNLITNSGNKIKPTKSPYECRSFDSIFISTKGSNLTKSTEYNKQFKTNSNPYLLGLDAPINNDQGGIQIVIPNITKDADVLNHFSTLVSLLAQENGDLDKAVAAFPQSEGRIFVFVKPNKFAEVIYILGSFLFSMISSMTFLLKSNEELEIELKLTDMIVSMKALHLQEICFSEFASFTIKNLQSLVDTAKVYASSTGIIPKEMKRMASFTTRDGRLVSRIKYRDPLKN